MKKFLITIAAGVMLAGCGNGGPSKSQVEAALIQHFEQASGGMRTTFERLDVGACEKVEGGPGHACAVDGQAVIDVGGRAQREALTATFVLDEVGGAWKVVAAH